jgi:hypothetical protein
MLRPYGLPWRRLKRIVTRLDPMHTCSLAGDRGGQGSMISLLMEAAKEMPYRPACQELYTQCGKCTQPYLKFYSV